MHKTFLMLGAFSGAIAVILGAFGAHGLKQVLSTEAVTVFQTGVQYQMYHTLALLVVAILFERVQDKWIGWAGNFFVLGIIFFSGSLYLITALKVWENSIPTFVGIITPVGGLMFIIGWLCLVVAFFRLGRSQG